MSPHLLIDKYNLTISLLITIAWQIGGFIIAWTFQFDKITDFTGGSNFFILALITLLTGGTYYARCVLPPVRYQVRLIYVPLIQQYRGFGLHDDMGCTSRWLPFVPRPKDWQYVTPFWWNSRMELIKCIFLFSLAFNLVLYSCFWIKSPGDTRFDDIRSHFFKFAGFWAGQILWVWVVALPVVVLNSPAVSDRSRGGDNPSFGTAGDIIGVILFAIGLFWEAVGDIQKYMFKSNKPPKGQPCTKGLWYFSRHPPYFGEITLHWGLWVLCLSPSQDGYVSTGARRAQIAAVVSPIFTILLLFFLSGLPTAEKPGAKRYFMMSYPPQSGAEFGSPKRGEAKNDIWANYKTYLSRTSIVIPIPPQLYRPLPEWFKRTVLLDFPFFRFDEEKDGNAAIEEARRQDA